MFLEAKFFNLKEFRTPKFLSSITKKKRNGHIFIRDSDPHVLAICGEKRHVRKCTLSCPLFYVLDNRKLSKNFDVIVQSLSHIRFFASPWTAARQASLSSSISGGLFRLMSIELVMDLESTVVQDDLILIWPLLLRLFSVVTFTGTWVKIATYLLFFCVSVLNCILYGVLLGDKLMVPLIWNE